MTTTYTVSIEANDIEAETTRDAAQSIVDWLRSHLQAGGEVYVTVTDEFGNTDTLAVR